MGLFLFAVIFTAIFSHFDFQQKMYGKKMFFSVLTAKNHKHTNYILVVVVGAVETVEKCHKPFCHKDFSAVESLSFYVEILLKHN